MRMIISDTYLEHRKLLSGYLCLFSRRVLHRTIVQLLTKEPPLELPIKLLFIFLLTLFTVEKKILAITQKNS